MDVVDATTQPIPRGFDCTRKSGEPPKIHAAMTAILKDARAIGKGSVNRQQGFNFRGIDAVMNHMHPLFAKHGVYLRHDVIDDRTEERETKAGGNLIYRMLKVRWEFVAEDGSREHSTNIGEGMDSGDKATNKALASSLKYMLTQTFLLPYDEVDADSDTPPPSTRKGRKKAPKPSEFSTSVPKKYPPKETKEAVETVEKVMGGQQEPAQQDRRPKASPDKPATEKQWKFFKSLCKGLDMIGPKQREKYLKIKLKKEDNFSSADISAAIEHLKNLKSPRELEAWMELENSEEAFQQHLELNE